MTFARRLALTTALLIVPNWGISQGAQSGEKASGRQFIQFGRTFFKSHRSGAQKHWFEKYRNPNSEQWGEFHTELHRGFRFEFIRGDRYTKDELGSFVLTDPTIHLPLGIRLGDRKPTILKILGIPDSTEGDFISYELDYEMSSITFRFSRDRLVEFRVAIDHE